MALRDKEAQRAYMRKWRLRNADRLREYDKKYRSENADRYNAARRRRYRTDPTVREKQVAIIRRWREANPDEHRNYRYLKKYGVSLERYNAMLATQSGRCAICSGDNPRKPGVKHWSIDHCHATGAVRGLLCHRCNLLIGQAGDSASLLRSAADYLDRTAAR